ncbi:hypothetical protein TH63_19185 [Rufibacter radiotolerans]|uniref:Uncharacterized protein n=1 Tax=Rufibacter radiotolerans TaxID=1379910 RepID=A0A0H4VPI7_9BACT|nr:hypothetical protein [Rufibacter radiotolerans]AKQ47840.1 hypothetical protein TH63_19185 [Rufibacter radiotolerans]
MPALDKELKKALLSLPPARKDKLLLQLLLPNQLLQEQLRFELLEGPEALEFRRDELRGRVRASAKGFYYNASELLVSLRQLCPLFSAHAKVTQDVYGEISLLLLLVKEVLQHQKEMVQVLSGANEALSLFLAKRTEEVVQKLQKLHEDLHVEFADEVNEVLPRLHASSAGYAARKLGVPVRWE